MEKDTESSQTSEDTAGKTDADELKGILQSITPQDALFLATSRLSVETCSIEGIVSIPWLRVFDFDETNYNNGFLGSVKQGIDNCRGIAISTQNDKPKEIFESRTDWIFMNGNQNARIPNIFCSIQQWIRKNNKLKFLKTLEKTQTEFCNKRRLVPLWLILWYEDKKGAKQDQQFSKQLLEKLLSSLLQFKRGKLVVCIPKRSPQRDSFAQFLSEQNVKAKLLEISLNEICDVMTQIDQVHWMYLPQKCGKQILFKQPYENSDYIELLPVNRNYYRYRHTTAPLGQDFVRGKQITWEEIDSGKVAVKRELEDTVITKIKEYAENRKHTKPIPVEHTPASGGTTFGKQVLWTLHTKYPCGVLQKDAVMNTENLAILINNISGQTEQRLVLLVDESQHDDDEVCHKTIVPPIVLYIQRVAKDDPSKDLQISDFVTNTEADALLSNFSKMSPNSQKVLKNLRDDVVLHHRERRLYEFALAAFNPKFGIVTKWVVGRLAFYDKNAYWKTPLVYLSLLMYFGNTGLQATALRKLLPIYITHPSDIPCASDFIVQDTDMVWKINHSAVAKEILEFYYGNPQSTASIDDNNDLSYTLKMKVSELFIDLIKYLKGICRDGGANEDDCIRILVEILIKRDSVLVQEGEKREIKKYKEAKAMRFAQPLEIFQELVTAFSNYPEFRAHLGKQYCRIQKFKEGYKEYDIALELCTDYTIGRNPAFTGNSFGRIHHMYATSIRTNVQRKITPNEFNDPGDYAISDIVDLTNLSCKHFSDALEKTQRNKTIPLIDEIELRLEIVEYVQKKGRTGVCSKFVEDSKLKWKKLFDLYMNIPNHKKDQFCERTAECQDKIRKAFPNDPLLQELYSYQIRKADE